MQVADGLEIRMVKVADLHEQELNAQLMEERDFERLTENIRERGALESVPYVYEDGGRLETVSGHHRIRAARKAGLEEIPALVDSRPMNRSQIVSKQLAHNYLVGHQDDKLVTEMLRMVDHVDDLLRSAAPDHLMPIPDAPKVDMSTPNTDFDWRVVTFVFLPRQMESFKELIAELEGRQDEVGVAQVELFPDFAKACATYSRIKEIRSVGTTIAVLTRIARDRIELQKEEPNPEAWVKLESVLSTDAIPAPVAQVMMSAMSKALSKGDVAITSPWQLFEFLAAQYLAGE